MTHASILRSLLIGLLLVVVPCAAQAPAKVWRVGFLATVPTTVPDAARNWAVFRDALHDRGYVEGRNVVFEQRFSEGRPERFPALAAELVRREVDVIVVVANVAAHVVKETTATIPVVMLLVANPVGSNLVSSLARPGGNLTGVADYQLELVPKRYELLKSTIPSATRVAMLACERCNVPAHAHVDAATIAAARSRRDAVAKQYGIALTYVDLSSPEDFAAATAAVVRERVDALFLYPSPANFALRRELAEFALGQKLPLFAPLKEQAAAGALLSYGPSQASQYRKAAEYVDKILRGAKPAELPIEQPTALELVVNLRTAKALGLELPRALLMRADEALE